MNYLNSNSSPYSYYGDFYFMSEVLIKKELFNAMMECIVLISQCVHYESLLPEYKDKYDNAIKVLSKACNDGEIELLLKSIKPINE